MGKVFLAHREGRDYALKFLNPGLGPEALGFFRGEVQVLSRLSHPNLVKIHDFYAGAPELWEGAGLPEALKAAPFFSMDYLDGPSLEAAAPNLNGEALVSLLAQIAQGLHYLHARNILHRDLKPSNIQLSPTGQAKILDFNLSVAGLLPGKKSLPLGTLPYMPPEAFRGEYLPQSDLFSLGVVLYRLASGRLPFAPTGNRFPAAPPRPAALREERPDLPEYLTTLIHRLLEGSPADRPSSALAVLKYLNQHRDEAIPILAEGATGIVLEKTPLVGRDAEVARILEQAAETERRSRPGWLEIKGPTGAGRSRLLEEAKWRFQLQGKFFAGLEAAPISAWLPKLAAELGMELPASHPDVLSLLRAFLAAAPRKAGAVAFRDLQDWREEDRLSLDLFFQLAGKTKLPWLFALEIKEEPEERAHPRSWVRLDAEARKDSLVLGDLGDAEAAQLLTLANPGLPLADTRTAEILRRAGGRPLFLLEELRAALEGKSGTRAAADGARSFQDFAAQRLAALRPETRELLALLVTHPRPPTWLQVEALKPDDPDALHDALLELDETGLLAPRSPADGRLRLAHPSLQDSFLGALPEAVVRRAHRSWADYLQTRAAELNDDDRLALADHAWGAGAAESLKPLGQRAAEILAARGRLTEALPWYERLLKIAAKPEDKVVPYAELAVLFFRLGDFDRALAAYDSWLAVREDDASRLQKIKHLYYTGLILFTAGRHEEARTRLQSALQTGDPERHPPLRPFLARAHSTLAALDEKASDFAAARGHLEAAHGLAQGNALLLGEIEQLLGGWEQRNLHFAAAHEHYRRCLDLYRQAKNLPAEAIAHQLLGQLQLERGFFEEALAGLKTSAALALQSGDILEWARYTENLGMAYLESAAYGEARQALESAEEVLDAWAKPEDRDLAALHRAALYLYLGNFPRSRKYLERVRLPSAPGGVADILIPARLQSAEAHYLQGRYQEAKGDFEAAAVLSASTAGLLPFEISLGIARTEARLGRLASWPRLPGFLQSLESLATPRFLSWRKILQFLVTPTEGLDETAIASLVKHLRALPQAEQRIDALGLLRADLEKRGLENPSRLLAEWRERELETMEQALPEENRPDFAAHRRSRKIND